jgi:hypothetical protein
MRFTPSIFGKLLEPIKRRRFDTLVARHAGNAYVKSFPSWIICSRQPARPGSGLERPSPASLPSGRRPAGALDPVDAKKRRPVAIFAETFSRVASRLDRRTRRRADGQADRRDPHPACRDERLRAAAHRRPSAMVSKSRSSASPLQLSAVAKQALQKCRGMACRIDRAGAEISSQFQVKPTQ